MPKRMIPFVSMQSIQTTPYVAFRQGRMSGNPGQCNIAGPNPLIGWRKEKTCCAPCFCTQVIQETSTITDPITTGDSVTGNSSGATGTITGITGSSPDRSFTIRLDDCDDPFTTSDNPTGGGGTGAGITINTNTITSDYEIGASTAAPCYSQNTRWQEVIKNTCCTPPIKRIQNRGGVIDASYSYTTRGYLESSCQSYKDNAFNFIDNSGANTFPKTCNVNICRTRAMATYKRNNSQFKKQGAVSSRARMNRLKYNTIVGAMPYTQQYFGGQTANKSIFKAKSKNCCFCSTGTLKNPCHGQNIPCTCSPH